MATRRNTLLTALEFIFRGEGLDKAHQSVAEFNRVTEETERKIENVIEKHRRLALAAKQAAKASTDEARKATREYEKEESALQKIIKDKREENALVGSRDRSEQRVRVLGQELQALRAIQQEQRELRRNESERRAALSKDIKASQDKVKALQNEVEAGKKIHQRNISQQRKSTEQGPVRKTASQVISEQPMLAPRLQKLSQTLGVSQEHLLDKIFRKGASVEEIGLGLRPATRITAKDLGVPETHRTVFDRQIDSIKKEFAYISSYWNKNYNELVDIQKKSIVSDKPPQAQSIEEPVRLQRALFNLKREEEKLGKLESMLDESIGGHEPSRMRAVSLREQAFQAGSVVQQKEREVYEWGTDKDKKQYEAFVEARNKSLSAKDKDEAEREFSRAESLYKGMSAEAQRRYAAQEIIDKIGDNVEVDTGKIIPRKQYGAGGFTKNEQNQIQNLVDSYKQLTILQEDYHTKNKQATDAERKFQHFKEEGQLSNNIDTDIRRKDNEFRKAKQEYEKAVSRLQHISDQEFLAREEVQTAEKAMLEATEKDRKARAELRKQESEYQEVNKYGEQGLKDIASLRAQAEHARSGGGDIGDISGVTGSRPQEASGAGGGRKPPKGPRSGGIDDIDDFLGDLGVGVGEESIGRKITGSYAAMYISRRVFLLHTYLKELITEFQHGLNWLRSVTQESFTAINMLKTQAMELAQVTPYSPLEIVQGQGALALAGFKTSGIMKMIPSVLDLAAAGKLGLENASKLLTSVILGYEMSADEISTVADSLAYIASNANTTVQELAPSFRYILSIAKGINVPLERLSAMIGVLRNAGQVAGTASRGLRAFYVRLAAPPGPAKEALREMGMDSADVRKRILAGGDIGLLQEFADMGEQADLGKLTTIFGRRHVASIRSLIRNVPRIRTLETELYGARGAAQEKAGILMSGLPGSVKRMESAVDNLIQVMGESGLSQVISTFAESVRGASNAVSNMPSIFKTFAVALFSIFTPLIGIAGLLKFTKYAMGGLFGKDFFTSMKKKPAGFDIGVKDKGMKGILDNIAVPLPSGSGKVFDRVKDAAKRAATVVGKVFKHVGVGKISLIIAGVAALGSVVWSVAQNWDKVTMSFKRSSDAMRVGLRPLTLELDSYKRIFWGKQRRELFERVAEETGDEVTAHKAVTRFLRYHRRGIRRDIIASDEYKDLPAHEREGFTRRELRRRTKLLMERAIKSDTLLPSLSARVREIESKDWTEYSYGKDERKKYWENERYRSMDVSDIVKENNQRRKEEEKKRAEEQKRANDLLFIQSRERLAKQHRQRLLGEAPNTGTIITERDHIITKPEIRPQETIREKMETLKEQLITKPEIRPQETRKEYRERVKEHKETIREKMETLKEQLITKPEIRPQETIRESYLSDMPLGELGKGNPADVFASTYRDMIAASNAMQGGAPVIKNNSFQFGDVTIPVTADTLDADSVMEIASDTLKNKVIEAVRSVDIDEGL